MPDKRRLAPRERVILGALVLALMYAAYYRAMRVHVVGSWSDPDDWRFPAAMAAVTTLFTYLTVLAAGVLLQSLGDRRRIARFLDGAPYRDDAFAAVEGKARAAGKTLVAPFSRRPCLAYEYDVWMGHGAIPGRRRSGQGRGWAGLAGVALAPTEIDGPQGPVRLLGWTPLQTHFRAEWFEGKTEANHERLRALLRERRFEKMTGARGLRLFKRLFDLQEDDDGALRHDWCLDAAALEAPRDVLISERVVLAGDRVAATGLWSGKRGGIYGQVGRVGLELWPGTLEERQRRLLTESLGRLLFMLVLAGGVHGIVALVWKSDEEVAARRAALQARQMADRFQSVLWQDLEATRAALRAGAPMEGRDHYGDTLLMTAARERDPRWVKMLIEEGADVHAENPRWGSALSQAIRSGKTEAIALLKTAGARDFRVTADDGRPLPRDGGAARPVIDRWYAAIEKGDRAEINAVSTDPVEGEIDWALWRRVRPMQERTIEGHARADAATLTVDGRDPDGHARRWGYHLVRAGEGAPWRILYEWEMD